MPSLPLLQPPTPLPASLRLHQRLVSPHPLLRQDRTHSVNLTQKMTCPSNQKTKRLHFYHNRSRLHRPERFVYARYARSLKFRV